MNVQDRLREKQFSSQKDKDTHEDLSGLDAVIWSWLLTEHWNSVSLVLK